MANFFETIINVLRADERFFTEDGELLRNAVVEASGKMDAKLIKALYENETTRERFFTDVDGMNHAISLSCILPFAVLVWTWIILLNGTIF